jgi:hypothetical protein
MILAAIKGIFGGGDAIKAVESIASEWIETDKEKAEARTLMIKTLDPNGLMRRDLSQRVAALYTVYLLTMLVLLVAEALGWGPMNGEVLAVSTATEKITELFAPISALFGVIITASFGVNYANVRKGQ